MRYNKYYLRKRELILKKYKRRCAYCGCKLTIDTLSIDHIEPLNRGIYFDRYELANVGNLNPCCQSCNSSKGNKNLEDWRFYLDELHIRLINNNSQYRLMVRMGLIKEPKSFIFYFERIKR